METRKIQHRKRAK